MTHATNRYARMLMGFSVDEKKMEKKIPTYYT